MTTAAPLPIHEEFDELKFRDDSQPNLHLVYWTRAPLDRKDNANLLFWNHGICEHAGRHKASAATLLHLVPELDAVCSYDMRNHGKSGGKNGYARSFDDLTHDAREYVIPRAAIRYGEGARIVLGGHSLGGMIILDLAAGPDFIAHGEFGRVVGIIASAPSVKPYVSGVLNKLLAPMASTFARLPYGRDVVKGTGIDPYLLAHDPKVGKAFIDDPHTSGEMTIGLGADTLSTGPKVIARIESEEGLVINSVPLLVIHSPDDQVTQFEGSEALVQAVQKRDGSEAKLVKVSGARHEMFNDSDEHGRKEFFDSIVEFLQKVFKE